MRECKAVIWGTVRGAVDKEPLPEASVSVVDTQWKAVADNEGRFRLELPPGSYTLRFFYELHRPALIKDVAVKTQQVEKIDVIVVPDDAAIETFEVDTQADKSSVEGQVLARQRSAAVGDGVGRAEISRTPATNAAQAAQRVVGATVVGERFIYVRGLGERYTNALLNDAPLPSPEPDRSAIPLDLFPSLILDNVNIVKTFLPDMPGDFAGGSVRIQTRELPSKPVYQLSLKLSGNDRSTFRERWAQRGSSTDFLGFDSGQRGLPSALRNAPLTDLGPEQQQQALADVNSYMSPKKSLSPVDYAVSGVLGNGWDLGRERRVGVLLTLNYGRGFGWRDDQILRSYRQVGDGSAIELRRSTDYRGEYGVDRVNWGTLASVSLWPSRSHRISLIGLRTQIADSSAHLVQGYNDGLG
ncbi:MAG TPA: carboxypeptidase regulatory-like domain-containing protein, partial [Polyangiaceae bacterium]|nr:carboxypeptidase regulatory-like domain-containing protein [Polyangiaceae bacterium]